MPGPPWVAAVDCWECICLSAVLVDVATWRWLFVLPIALVLVAIAMTMRSVPNSREANQNRFDTIGSITSVIAVLGMIFALHEGPVHGWTEPATLTALIAGLLATFAFLAWELRQRSPLLDIRLFRDRRLATGSLSLLTAFGVQAGIVVVLFPFLQVVLGWSALNATVGMLPMALQMMFSSVIAPRVATSLGSRRTMATGILLISAGLVLMALLVSTGGGYLTILPGMLTLGLGMGLAMTPSTEAITSSLPRDQQGLASALNDVTREFGTAIGVALLGAVLTAGYRTSIGAHLDGIPADVAEPAREGVANAIAAAANLGTHSAVQVDAVPLDALVLAAKNSFVDGWQHAMWAGSVVMAILLVYVLVRGPLRAADDVDETEDAPATPDVVTP